jgi:hypothetical protein
MTINITWQDIRAGKFMSTSHCMVALAIKRELGADYVSVGLDDVRIRVDGRYLTLRLPPEVGSKIRWWERFHLVFPFSFEFPGFAFGSGSANAVASDEKTIPAVGGFSGSPAIAY